MRLVMVSTNKGFTLLEVLVASVIMISAVAAISMAYRGAFIASERAEKHVNITSAMPMILSQVRKAIRQPTSESSTEPHRERIWGVNYQWRAEAVANRKPPQRYDVEAEDFVTSEREFTLWRVILDVEQNGIRQQYEFFEVSWNEEI